MSQSAMVSFLGDKMIHVLVTFLNDLTRGRKYPNFRDDNKCMKVFDSGEGWMNEEGRMRGGAGRVPRPKGEGERSLESSNFCSLGRRQRAFESSNPSFVSCYL